MLDIILTTNGQDISGWQEVEIGRSMENFTGSFNIGLYLDEGGQYISSLNAGDECVISIKPTSGPVKTIPILKGYINAQDDGIEARATNLTVGGEDITQDLVDCSASVPSNGWTKATLVKMVEDLVKPYGLYVADYTDSEKTFKNITLQEGEKVFSVIERLTRQEGVLPLTNRFGHVVLTYAADENSPAVTDLIQGGEFANVLSLHRSQKINKRFSEYTLKGQNSGGGKSWSKDNVKISKTAKDSGVKRHRPLTVLTESKTDGAQLQKRANWEAQVRAGRAMDFTAKLNGWFIDPEADVSAARPWQINSIVNLSSEYFKFENVRYLVTGVTFTFNKTDGAKTVLELKDPRTYAANPSKEI